MSAVPALISITIPSAFCVGNDKSIGVGEFGIRLLLISPFIFSIPTGHVSLFVATFDSPPPNRYLTFVSSVVGVSRYLFSRIALNFSYH